MESRSTIAIPNASASASETSRCRPLEVRDWSRRVLWPRIADHFGVPTPPIPEAHPLDRYVTGLPAGMIAKQFGFGGGVRTVDAACASSLYAIKLAIDDLLAGRVDAMLAGGMAKPDPLYTQMGFCQLHALSPSGTCRPFDAGADGLVVGEGACFFVLERLADAVRLKRNILGVIHGVGLSNDVGGNILAPDSEGQLRALRSAYCERRMESDRSFIDRVPCDGNSDGRPSRMVESRRTLEGIEIDGWLRPRIGEEQRRTSAHRRRRGRSRQGPWIVRPQAEVPDRELRAVGVETMAPRRRSKCFPRLAIGRRPPTADQDARPSARSGSAESTPICSSKNGASDHWERRSRRSAFQVARSTFPSSASASASANGSVRKSSPHGRCSATETSSSDCDLECRTFDVPVGRFPIPPKEFADLLPQQTLMLEAVDEAWREIGGDSLPAEARKRVGGYFGISLDLNTTNFDLRWSMREFAEGRDLDELRDRVSPPLIGRPNARRPRRRRRQPNRPRLQARRTELHAVLRRGVGPRRARRRRSGP